MKSFRIIVLNVAANRTCSLTKASLMIPGTPRSGFLSIFFHSAASAIQQCSTGQMHLLYPGITRSGSHSVCTPRVASDPTSGGSGTTLDPFWYHSRSVLVVLYRSGN